jgi:phosphoenolpyruvate-protein phosphotransferase/dihydroxyacetone kinase phosphotransfer subunit
MTSLVLVCHSSKLAEGVRELAQQVARGKISVFATGGLDEDTPGTNPDHVRELLEVAENPGGILVLMDIGSSILGTQMALDDWPPERKARVVLCEAPLVEGAMAAAAQLAAGATLQEAAEEARTALGPKASQLSAEPTVPRLRSRNEPTNEMSITIVNPLGLHARPAALFVKAASRFKSEIRVRNVTLDTPPVNGKSVNGLALLDARKGNRIAIVAEGPDADEALGTLRELVHSGFGEDHLPTEAPTPQRIPSNKPNTLTGIPVSSGIALGPAHIFIAPKTEFEKHRIEDPEAEWARLEEALIRSKEEVAMVRQEAVSNLGKYDAAIFDVHLLILEDPTLLGPVHKRIFREHLSAEAAWQAQVEEIAGRYARSSNALLSTRASDILDVGARVLRRLTGPAGLPTVGIDSPSIIVAHELTPSETAALDSKNTLAICTVLGGPTSHSAILARRLGVPAVLGLGENLMEISEGTLLAVDGVRGEVTIRPNSAVRSEFETRLKEWHQRHPPSAVRRGTAVTRDKQDIAVLANIATPSDAQSALEYGAEGVGLLRTEFLYLDRRTPPTEDEQVESYRVIFAVMSGRPITVRTFDIGGDKAVPYISATNEKNPFLGLRGLRLALDRVDLLRTQLRAILRAGKGHEVKVMFPMVATVDEIRRARTIFEDVMGELRTQQIPIAESIELGIMIETPSAALLASAIAPLVGFFSIGSNDLTQYTLAADRTNSRTATLTDGMHPAVLRLIKQVVDEAHRRGKRVGLCGELSSDPTVTPILVGLGLDELSMNPQAIPGVKAVIARITVNEARTVADRALAQDSAEDVRALVQPFSIGTD